MSSKLKYQLQKHRAKIRVAVSVVLFLAALLFLYFLVIKDNWDIFEFGPTETTLAEHIVSGDKSGKLSVFDTETFRMIAISTQQVLLMMSFLPITVRMFII